MYMRVQILAGETNKRVMVFCNSISSCRAVDHHLSEAGTPTVCFHGDMPAPMRKVTIATFTSPSVAESPAQPVLVCTDLAARGIDMPARVDHVINFDMPSGPTWYLHRSGRTARAGADGAVTSLMQSAADRTLGFRIENALKNNLPLDELSPIKALRPDQKKNASPDTKTKGSNHRKVLLQEARQRERATASRGRGGRGESGRHGAGRGAGGRGATQGWNGGRSSEGARGGAGRRGRFAPTRAIPVGSAARMTVAAWQ